MDDGSTLSVFVDESGRFQCPDAESHYYIVGLVFHDQAVDIGPQIAELGKALSDLGIDPDAFVFHAGPLVRKEKGYEYFSRNMRGRIYDRMFTFARKVDFKFRCLIVDKRYTNSSLQLLARLQKQIDDLLLSQRSYFESLERVKVYYDCGQAPVTNLLHKSFAVLGCPVVFAQGVRPANYKLFQIADLVCTLSLVSQKLSAGEKLTESEWRFFGGARAFRHREQVFLEKKRL